MTGLRVDDAKFLLLVPFRYPGLERQYFNHYTQVKFVANR
jgi:hypothetical protein